MYLKWLVRELDFTQKNRVAYQLRRQAMQKNGLKSIPTLDALIKFLEDYEKQLTREIRRELKNYPIYTEWLSKVPGVGVLSAARLIAYIGDIKRFPTASKLRRYCGYAVINGRAERGAVDGRRHYNGACKKTLYQLESSFIMHDTPYGQLYRRIKERVMEKNSDWPNWKKERKARRIMIQLFLSHLYEVWSRLEGLEVRPPYPIEYLGHQGYITPYELLKE